ncbi:MAG: type II toxin-antitoxin system RelE family toxin [Pirellulales bacterium]
MYSIEYAESIADDLRDVRAFDRTRVLDGIETQLTDEPTREARSRKMVIGLKPPWDYEEPLWQLRIGDFRVFYDVDETQKRVSVRAVRLKPPHKTTEEMKYCEDRRYPRGES